MCIPLEGVRLVLIGSSTSIFAVMRIGILGQPCLDEIITPVAEERSRSLGGILFSYAAMERLMREARHEADRFVPLTWLSLPDRDLLEPFLTQLTHLAKDAGLWPTSERCNRVQLVYRDATHRVEHCPSILPPVGAKEVVLLAAERMDGLFVNMISGFDITLDSFSYLLTSLPKRPHVHLDIHALILGELSNGAESSFGAGRVPRGVPGWRKWLALSNSVQLNEMEVRWIGDPEITTERELVRAATAIAQKTRLKYLIVTRAAKGATIFDLVGERDYTVAAPQVRVLDPTGSGDVFGSAFVYHIVKGDTPRHALEEAVRWASWNTTLRSIDDILSASLPNEITREVT